jgi:hypothetical protein
VVDKCRFPGGPRQEREREETFPRNAKLGVRISGSFFFFKDYYQAGYI